MSIRDDMADLTATIEAAGPLIQHLGVTAFEDFSVSVQDTDAGKRWLVSFVEPVATASTIPLIPDGQEGDIVMFNAFDQSGWSEQRIKPPGEDWRPILDSDHLPPEDHR